MIDTVSVNIDGIQSTPTPELMKNQDPDWTFTSRHTQLSHSGETRVTGFGIDNERVAKAYFGDKGKPNKVEASLARLLTKQGKPRSNGIHLKNPEELHIAKCLLLDKVRNFCERVYTFDFCSNPDGARPIEQRDAIICRLDLALNLNLDPRMILASHRHARHPMIRREVQSYSNVGHQPGKATPFEELNTVRFDGAKTSICLYDKVRETFSKNKQEWPDDIHCVRVEVQLRGEEHIAKWFGRDEPITLADLEYGECYRVYRLILCQFDSVGKIPTFKPDLSSLLAVLYRHPETWVDFGGMDPLDWYRTTKGITNKRFNEMRLDVGRQVLDLSPFRWSEILPEDRLPDVVDVDESGLQTLVPSPYQLR